MTVLNASVLRLTSEQFGIITRPQLLRCGLSEGQVEGLVARAALEKVHCGTYRIPGTAVPPEQAAMAAAIRCRPKAWLTGPFVLGLLRVEGFSTADSFEVLVPADRRVQNVAFRVRPDPLAGQFTAVLGPLPIVTATRALIDTARTVGGKRLIVGIDSARWLGLTRVDRLLRCAECYHRHRGARLIRELVASGALDYESKGERGLSALFSDYDPPLETQVWITPKIRVDFLWRDVRMILEFDGKRHHGLPHDREDDEKRDLQLERLGYHVEHVTGADLANPAALRARILTVRRTLVKQRRASA
ncbi:MAG: DUF559 domain-containing protein [Egibacteraceae bacterium]